VAEGIAQIVAELQKSRKYRSLCSETLERVAKWSQERYPSQKAATKAAKRKLHQVYGAYVGQVDANEILTLLDQLDAENPKPICEQILHSHVSTAERFDNLADVYDAIWEITGVPNRVMDLACGLNPFTVSWMNGVNEYFACDIDVDLAKCIGKFFENLGFNGYSTCQDLLVSVPDWQADVVFLLKALPCLEQQEKDAGRHILNQIQAPYVVVSFPAQSIGGQDKGMAGHYARVMDGLIADLQWGVQKLSFTKETYYVLSRSDD